MRIDLGRDPQAVPEGKATTSQTAGAAGNQLSGHSPIASSATGPDLAQISSGYTQVQALTAQAIQLPDVRAERVQSLRLAVESGSYKPGAENVADAIVSHMIGSQAA